MGEDDFLTYNRDDLRAIATGHDSRKESVVERVSGQLARTVPSSANSLNPSTKNLCNLWMVLRYEQELAGGFPAFEIAMCLLCLFE